MFRGEHDGGPRFALVYNGALYNDQEVRRELAAAGVHLRTSCDTETVLAALAHWGDAALPRLRGMYALALADTREQTLTLARDPLGIKPLYYALQSEWVGIASEPGPLLGCPGVNAEPDLPMVGAFLATIRTVLGGRTLFRGICAVEPGQVLRIDLCGRSGAARISGTARVPLPVVAGERERDEAAARVRTAVDESVRLHLRADVPVCALLSGGLDSTAVTMFAKRQHSTLQTFCAGCPEGEQAFDSDLESAKRIAAWLKTEHREAHVDREKFLERWPEMVGRLGVPLSTPNEVAIHEVAQTLRSTGCIVTLSGEGADELFAGYDAPLEAAARMHEELRCAASPVTGRAAGRIALAASGWIDGATLGRALLPEVWRGIEDNAFAQGFYEERFEQAWKMSDGHALAAHQRLLREVNLTGLLQRLDTATMLAGVEGRTPLADARVAALAEALPMELKYRSRASRRHAPLDTGLSEGAATATLATPAHAARTKLVLRRALRRDVPGWVLRRPKASFPLPFQSWIGALEGTVRRSPFIRGLFTPAAIEAAASDAPGSWRLAWPMINLALWAERWGWR